MTNGWRALTSGAWRQSSRGRLAVAIAVFAAVAIVDAVVNAASVLDDRRREGAAIESWEPFLWESTSAFAWLLLAPLIFLAARKLRPPQYSWPVAILSYAMLTVPVSLAHVGIMLGLRELAYAAAGAAYRLGTPVADVLLYEYRKDALSCATLILFFLLFERVAAPQPHRKHTVPPRLEVRDGSRTRWLAADEIEWAQSAGNYVELFGTFGTMLQRQTLASLATELEPHGFVRIHRSRIVRKDAVRGVDTRASGDFEVTLASNTRIGGSRRFRDALL